MSAKVRISSPGCGLEAHVVNGEEHNALVVATRELKTYTGSYSYFRNPAEGVDMNVDASFGGTPELVHDGNDNAAWVGSAVIGTWDFTDAAQNHTPAGAASVGCDLIKAGDIAQFTRAAAIDLSAYEALTMWIYVVTGWDVGDDISLVGWDTATGVAVGSPVNLGNYFNYLITGAWQQLAIPLQDMGLEASTIDAFRVVYTVKSGIPASFYIDDFQIEETSGVAVFSVEPATGTWLRITKVRFAIVDALDTTLADASMWNLSYNQILGVAQLNVGIGIDVVVNGVILRVLTFRDIAEALEHPGAAIENIACDGTNTFLTLSITLSHPALLKSEDGDSAFVVISDDLSGLLRFRGTISGFEEQREGMNCDG